MNLSNMNLEFYDIPMRLLCIEANWDTKGDSPTLKYPKEGEVYVSVDETKEEDKLYYRLAEFESYRWFEAEAFVPLTGDETEVLEEIKEEVEACV